MIPVSLKLSNFTSYGETVPELDFTKFHLAAISGFNGAGKSSILDAITWCLWGSSRLGDSSDSLVRLGQKEMDVSFSFDLDGSKFTVIRKRFLKGGGSTSLDFLSGNHNLTEGTIKATQQKIIDTLHLSFDTFINSAFIRQGHADEFTTKGPTERKKILADILGLSHYDLLEEKAKEKAKEAQTKLQLLSYQILEIEAELTQKEERSEKKKVAEETLLKLESEIKNLESQLKNFREEKETISIASEQRVKLLQNYEQNKKELDEILQQGKDRKEKITSLEEKLESLKGVEGKLTNLKSLQEEKEKQENLRQQESELEKKISEIKGQINLKKQKANQLKNEIEKIDKQINDSQREGAKCPTCGQEISKGEKEYVHKTLTTQKEELETTLKKVDFSDEEKEAEKLDNELKALNYDSDKLHVINSKLLDLEKIQKQKEELIGVQATLEAEKKVVLELRGLFTNKKNTVDALEEEVKKLPDLSEKLNSKNQEIIKAEEELDSKRQLEKDARNTLGQITELISRTAQMEKNKTAAMEKQATLQREKESFEELSLAFGKKGIQAMIIETTIPEVEEEANNLLSRLTDGRMSIRLDTQRETKGKVAGTGEKGLVETLDIIISDEMGERPYEAYSVAGDELVYVRQNGQIKSLPIQNLWSEQTPIEVDGGYQFQNTNTEALCYVNSKALWQKVDKILRHKSPPKILEVKAGPGNYTVKLTPNHSVYVLTVSGLQIKRTSDLKRGDFLLSPSLIPSGNHINKVDFMDFISDKFLSQREINNKCLKFNDNCIWSRRDQKINRCTHLDENLAKLMGSVVAEGSGKTAYSVAAGSNPYLASEVTLLASQVFGNNQRTLGYVSEEQMKHYSQTNLSISSINPKAQYNPKIGGRLIAEIIKNIVGRTALDKKIPVYIFNASKEIQLAFLKGLVEGDGYLSVNKGKSKSEVCITTIGSRLVGEVIFLCRQLGIWARVENHGQAGFRRGMNHQKSYRIVISGKKNLEILGMGEVVSNYNTSTKHEGIPYALVGKKQPQTTSYNKRFQRNAEYQQFFCGVPKVPLSLKENYQKIQEMVTDWNILEIKEIKEIKTTSAYVYDLMVPGNNSFVAGNGAILVHNSGGEQFRINLSIRLALSKLLTHRAGAKLQFLVIDEGFGTQDVQGRSKIVETLDVIKNDFEKIIVITHLDELKEEFPVRVEVSKSPSGSTFEVIGT